MRDENALGPYEAALAANNVYYTLSGWADHRADKTVAPTRGMEQWDTVQNQVI
jgi:hypothetical protein